MRDVYKEVLVVINLALLLSLFIVDVMVLLIPPKSYINVIIAQTIFIPFINILMVILFVIDNKK